MPTFQYQGVDPEGQPASGTLVAGGAEEARGRLEAAGLRVERLVEVEVPSEARPASSTAWGERLSVGETAELAATLSRLTSSGLPLGAGLGAAARELPRGRLARSLDELSRRLEAGMPLDEALAALGSRFPAHVRELVLAGIQSGGLGEVLEQLVHLQRKSAAVRRDVWHSLAYPAMLLAIVLALFVFHGICVIPGLAAFYADFEIQVPLATRLLIGMSGGGTWALVGNVAALAAGGLLIWFFSGVPEIRRMLNRVPLLGPIARWNSLADFARLLALLVERAIPLPAAVPLAGGGSRDSDLAAACDEASRRLGRGFSFRDSITGLRQFPRGLGPIVQWGEQGPALAEALWTAAEMFDGHVQSRLTLLRTVAPPLTFLLVVGSVFFLITGALSPLVTLIDSMNG